MALTEIDAYSILSAALAAGTLLFHAGRVGGAWPRIIK